MEGNFNETGALRMTSKTTLGWSEPLAVYSLDINCSALSRIKSFPTWDLLNVETQPCIDTASTP